MRARVRAYPGVYTCACRVCACHGWLWSDHEALARGLDGQVHELLNVLERVAKGAAAAASLYAVLLEGLTMDRKERDRAGHVRVLVYSVLELPVDSFEVVLQLLTPHPEGLVQETLHRGGTCSLPSWRC